MNRRTTALAALIASACVLTACGGHSSSTSSESLSSATTSPQPGGAPSPSLSPSPSATEDKDGGSTAHRGRVESTGGRNDRCHTGDLAASADNKNSAAGSTYLTVTLINKSDHPCTLYGYPGVSAVGGDDGHQIGKPAEKTAKPTPSLVTLIPGHTASAQVQVTRPEHFSPRSCTPENARGLRVYPPDEEDALFVDAPIEACSGTVSTMHVTPLGNA